METTYHQEVPALISPGKREIEFGNGDAKPAPLNPL